MKKYVVRNKTTNEVLGKFDTKNQASDKLVEYLTEKNEVVCSDDARFVSIFDFDLQEEDVQDISSYEEALSYLCELSESIDTRHEKALESLEKLFVIAQAWNKQDEFIPDFSNKDQSKFFPWFKYDKTVERFVCWGVRCTDTCTNAYTNAYLGSRLCFDTPERALAFGKKFEGLYNDFLLM